MHGNSQLEPLSVDISEACRLTGLGRSKLYQLISGGEVQSVKQHPAGLFVMAADYLWLPCPAPPHDLVVVDESIIDKAAETVSFDPTRITDDQKWAGGELEEAMERRRIALLIRAAVTQHPGRELAFLRAQGVTTADLKTCIEHLRVAVGDDQSSRWLAPSMGQEPP